MAPNGNRRGRLVPAAQDLQGVRRPTGAGSGKRLVSADKVHSFGEHNGGRPLLRIKGTGDEDLTAYLAVRKVKRVNIGVEQVVGQFGALRGAQRICGAPKRA